MKRKVTYTTEEVRKIIEMSPVDQKAILEKTEEMSQLSLAELEAYNLDSNDPQMLHAIRTKMLKRAEAAERRRKRKEQKEAAAKQQEAQQTEQQATQHAAAQTMPVRYDRETLRCAVTVANLFNGGVAFRDHSYRWTIEADDKFEYEMDGTMKCIEKIVRRLLKQSSRTERDGLRQLLFHRLHSTATACINSTFAKLAAI